MPLPILLTEQEYKDLLDEFGVEGLGVHKVTYTDPSDMELQSALWHVREQEEKAVADEEKRKEKLRMLKKRRDAKKERQENKNVSTTTEGASAAAPKKEKTKKSDDGWVGWYCFGEY